MISIPPFVVITFESTVLIAGLATLAAIIYHCRLPAMDLPIECEDPRYSSDRFGLVFHDLEGARKEEAIKLLHDSGAEEVSCADDEDDATELVHEEA